MALEVLLHTDASKGFRETIERHKPDWMEIQIVAEADRAGLDHHIREAEVLLHVLEPITEDMINIATNLRLIQKLGVGVDTIDLEAARLRNVLVANMPGTNTNAVAEMTLALMLSTLRRITFLNEQVRAGTGWELPNDSLDRIGELRGSTVGLLGMGLIAREVAELVRAFGANVIYANRTKKDVPYRHCSMDELMARADVISVHIPLTPDTLKIIDESSFAKMKASAVLVNTARGGVVDQAALLRALKTGRIAGAGLDVFAIEPLTSTEFSELENAVLTPHVAWLTPQTLERSVRVAFDNCARLRDGEQVLNVIQ